MASSSDTMIQDATTRLAFRRGADIAAAGGVLSWSDGAAPAVGALAKAGRSAVRVSGTVEEHGRSPYRPAVTLDLAAGRVFSHSCDCPAGDAPGMCKHCVALALAYLEDRERRAAAAAQAQLVADARAAAEAAAGEAAAATDAEPAAGEAHAAPAPAAGGATAPEAPRGAAPAQAPQATPRVAVPARAPQPARPAASAAPAPAAARPLREAPRPAAAGAPAPARTPLTPAARVSPAPTSAPAGARPRPGAPRPSSAADPLSAGAMARLKAQTRELLEQYRGEATAASEDSRSAGPVAIQEPQTSTVIGPLVLSYARTRSADDAVATPVPRFAASEEGPVELLATLSPAGRVPGGRDGVPAGRVWNLGLHVARGSHSYVVRRLDELVGAWDAHAEIAFGRDLCVVCVPEAFSARARVLLDVVSRTLRSQEASRAMQQRAADAAGTPAPARPVNPRELPLPECGVVDILDALQGASVDVEVRVPAGGTRRRTLRVGEGAPELSLTVTENRRGGYDLTLPADVDCVVSPDGMYVLTAEEALRCDDAYRATMAPFCRAVLPARAPLHIRTDDMPGFCGAVLPAVAAHVRADLPEGIAAFAPRAAKLSFRLALVGGHVTCVAEAAYGERSVGLFEPIAAGQPVRDLARERVAADLVRSYFAQSLPAAPAPRRAAAPGAKKPAACAPQPWEAGTELPRGSRPCIDASDAGGFYRLLTEGLGALAKLGSVYMDDALRAVAIRPAPHVHVSVAVRSGLLDIAVDPGDLSPADLVAYLASYQRKEHFVRLSNGDIARLDDDAVRTLANLAGGLGITPEELVAGTGRVPSNRAPFVDALLGRTEGVTLTRDESFSELIDAFDNMGSAEYPEPKSLKGSLRPYQREGFRWLSTLARFGFGGILADDMGLGKTLQLIAFLLAQHEQGRTEPSLVVCPASLVYNWMGELARFAPGLAACAVTGTREERARLVQTARGYDVLVTSYDLLKRDVDLYERQRFFCQVLDEAQYIKNHATQTARCAKRVDAEVRLALTGTPIENRLAELWSIFDFLMPGLLGSYEAFRHNFESPVAEGDDGSSKRLRDMVAPFILRRMKSDVLGDLPDKTESVVTAHMEGEQERLYCATASQLAMTLAHQLPSDFAHDRIAVLAELTRLRQICCDPHLLYENYEGPSAKLECALELVANAVDSGHKVLLFSQFTSMLDIIGERLEAAGTSYHVLTGATSKEERARLVEEFSHDDVPVFLISLKAGGVGLNLTAADIVIHYDPWWNLAAQNQATDRAHRIGQSKEVSVFRLIAKGTIEEKIVELQESKRDLAESILGGEAAASGKLTKEAVLALLGA